MYNNLENKKQTLPHLKILQKQFHCATGINYILTRGKTKHALYGPSVRN